MTNKMQKIKRFISKKGFTLVELIIVIAIVAILSVVAFMVVTKWIGKSKDSRRLADLGAMKRAMEITLAESNYLKMPDAPAGGSVTTGTVGGVDMAYAGVFGDGVVSAMKNMKSAPVDPVTNNNYGYGIDASKKKYQVAVGLEDGTITSELMNSAYAAIAESRVDGNYGISDIYKYDATNNVLAAVPSLIFKGAGTVDLSDKNAVTYVVNGGGNLPFSLPGASTSTESPVDSLSKVIGWKGASMTDIKVDLNAGTASSNVTALAAIVPNKDVLTTIVSKVNASSTGGVVLDTNAISSVVITGTVVKATMQNISTNNNITGSGVQSLNGSCGTANKSYANGVSTFGSDTFCSAGTVSSTPTFPSAGNSVTWSCNGSAGGTNASCSASQSMPASVNGVCGSSHGGGFNVAPNSNLCSAGTAGTVNGSGPWSWSCAGQNGGTNASCSAIYVSGGIITTVGSYKVHTFNSNGTLVISGGNLTLDYLVVGGGGGGGFNQGGGGGGGGVMSGVGYVLTPGTYNIVIGNGGGIAAEGNDTTFATITAKKGGPGGYANNNATAGTYGCGGGGGYIGGLGAVSLGNGQGFGGGNAGTSISFPGGGGGGGAGGVGLDANSAGGGIGGIGVLSSISGVPTYYGGGGGGGGGHNVGNGGAGGNGGGGAGAGGTTGVTGSAGTANTGGGGGGGGSGNGMGGVGGSGVVIVRHP